MAVTLFMVSFNAYAEDKQNINNTKAIDASKYIVNVDVDADNHRISGKVTMKIRNNTNKTIKKLYFRNYAASILGKKGKSVISNLKINNKSFSLKKEKDKSVLYAVLGKKALKPGTNCKAAVNFKTDIPKQDDRFGYHAGKGALYINLSYCFPELAAYENGKWMRYPYLNDAESNYNRVKNYTVKIKAPAYLNVIAAGNEKKHGSETIVKAPNVRDMAIVLSDNLKKTSKTVKGVRVNYYGIKSKHMKAFNKLQLATACDCVRMYTEKFGKYPYKELDVVASFRHGMEFSGLVMCNIPDCRAFKDVKKNANYYRSSIVVAHEVAHQWFYNKVGSNPYTEPWLDEGFSDFCENYIYQFSNTKTLKSIRKEDKKRGLYSIFEEMKYKDYCMIQKTEYSQTKKKFKGKVNWSYNDFNKYTDYSQVVYRNGAYFLNCLKTRMGSKRFFKMMRDYCGTYAFKEATTKDFIKKVYQYDNSKEVKSTVKKFIL